MHLIGLQRLMLWITISSSCSRKPTDCRDLNNVAKKPQWISLTITIWFRSWSNNSSERIIPSVSWNRNGDLTIVRKSLQSFKVRTANSTKRILVVRLTRLILLEVMREWRWAIFDSCIRQDAVFNVPLSRQRRRVRVRGHRCFCYPCANRAELPYLPVLLFHLQPSIPQCCDINYEILW